tara:strand:+ start:98 stop:790 length:693 start_codon:yes stop_codon:yes gene_type:complete
MNINSFESLIFSHLDKNFTLKKARELTGGGITKKNKKMPFYNYDLSAKDCIKGSVLRNVKGSVCEGCYADKGNFHYPSVKVSHKKHLESLKNGFLWSMAMAYQILYYKAKYFRFHASGDLQSLGHAIQIINLAKLTPSFKYWIPTRETKILKELKEQNISIPKNCIFRVSAPLINGHLNSKVFRNTSSVITSEKNASGKNICPSLNQGGMCLDCRNCWNTRIKNINYLYH